MRPSTKTATGCALGGLALLGALLGLPFLAAAGGGPGVACAPSPPSVEDGTPSILGPSTLTAGGLVAWWSSTGREQPERLALPVEDVIALYLFEGDAEGVRGDLAFAQAVLETGYFTNSDTAINNFAGIAHYDGASSGSAFPDVPTGVRAHIQLLKKFAAGNEVALAAPDVAPAAGATATTWGALTGTWATASNYWESLSAVFESMAGDGDVAPAERVAPGMCPSGVLAMSDDYALPVEKIWYDQHSDWFTKPHHDYPAADLPIPTGTPLYNMTRGVVVSTPTSGRCGVGVVVNGDDGAQYTYCHGLPGSHAVEIGDSVSTGQLLMLSASTGNSTGPHLHLGIVADGQQRCPQPLFVAIAEGSAISPFELPTTGCTYVPS